MERPKFSQKLKRSWIAAIITTIAVATPVVIFYSATQGTSDLAAGFFLYWLFPAIVALVPVLWLVVVVDVVLVFVTLFYLLKREREYSKTKSSVH